MGIDPFSLSDKQKSMIEPSDREKGGRTLQTRSESLARVGKLLERKIHDQFSDFCHRHKIIVWHSNPTKKSSIRVGLPDFLCLRNDIAVCIEFKVLPNNPTIDQKRVFQDISDCGNSPVHVCIENAPGAAYAQATAILKDAYKLDSI